MPWRTWVIDQATDELVGPCGCREPNNYGGFDRAAKHVCPQDQQEVPD